MEEKSEKKRNSSPLDPYIKKVKNWLERAHSPKSVPKAIKATKASQITQTQATHPFSLLPLSNLKQQSFRIYSFKQLKKQTRKFDQYFDQLSQSMSCESSQKQNELLMIEKMKSQQKQKLDRLQKLQNGIKAAQQQIDALMKKKHQMINNDLKSMETLLIEKQEQMYKLKADEQYIFGLFKKKQQELQKSNQQENFNQEEELNLKYKIIQIQYQLKKIRVSLNYLQKQLSFIKERIKNKIKYLQRQTDFIDTRIKEKQEQILALQSQKWKQINKKNPQENKQQRKNV